MNALICMWKEEMLVESNENSYRIVAVLKKQNKMQFWEYVCMEGAKPTGGGCFGFRTSAEDTLDDIIILFFLLLFFHLLQNNERSYTMEGTHHKMVHLYVWPFIRCS